MVLTRTSELLGTPVSIDPSRREDGIENPEKEAFLMSAELIGPA
jgi:hypothetical protein